MRKISIVILVLGIMACSRTPELKGFDTEKWINDKGGCENYRISVVDTLISQSEGLMGLSQNQMADLLGKADQHELYERSQKFFIYHLESGKNCESYQGKYFNALYIRFNSLDQAVAFTIQEVK